MARCMKRLTAMCLAVTLLLGQLVLPAGAQTTTETNTVTTPAGDTVTTVATKTESDNGLSQSTTTITESADGTKVTVEEHTTTSTTGDGSSSHQDSYQKTETDYATGQQTVTGSSQTDTSNTEVASVPGAEAKEETKEHSVTEKEQLDPPAESSTTTTESETESTGSEAVKRDETVDVTSSTKDEANPSESTDAVVDLNGEGLTFEDTIVTDDPADADQYVEAETTVYITTENIRSGEYNLEELSQQEGVTVDIVTDAEGNVIGYNITTKTAKTETKTEAEATDEEKAGYVSKSDSTTTTNQVTNADYESKFVNNAETVTNGDTTTTVSATAKTDENGKPYYEQTTTVVTTQTAKEGESLGSVEIEEFLDIKGMLLDENPPKPQLPDQVLSDGRVITYKTSDTLYKASAVDGSGNRYPFGYYKITYTVHNLDGTTQSGTSMYLNIPDVESSYEEPALPTREDFTDADGRHTAYTVLDKVNEKGEKYYEVTYKVTGPEGQDLGGGVDEIHGSYVYTYAGYLYDPESETMDVAQIVTEKVMKEKITFTETVTETVTDQQGEDRTQVEEVTGEYDMKEETFVLTSKDIVYDENGNPMFLIEGKLYAIVDNGEVYDDINFNNEEVTDMKFYEDGHWIVRKEVAGNGGYMFYVNNNGIQRAAYCIEQDQAINVDNSPWSAQYVATHFRDGVHEDGIADWGDSIEELRSIALNGYWKTAEGQGSLESVKDLLRRNMDKHDLTEDQINSLTEAEAAAGTQYALWKYGSENDYMPTLSNAKSNALRNLLVELAEVDATNVNEKGEYAGAAQAITGESISGVSLKLYDQVVDTNTGEVKRDASGNVTYNAEVAFKLDVSTSSINGDLVVKVRNNNGDLMKTYRLASDREESNFLDELGRDMLGTIRPEADGSFILEGLQLTENLKFSIKLEGVQHLDDGVVIYAHPDVQDVISAAYIDNKVDLEFAMDFSVTGDEAQSSTLEYQQSQSSRVVYDVYATSSSSHIQKTVEFEDGYVQTTKTGTARFRVTQVKVLDKTQVTKSRWERYYEYLMSTPFGGDTMLMSFEEGGNPGGNPGGAANPNAVVIPDEQVPLAVAPATGDVSYIWAAVSVLSLAAYFILNRKPKMV